MNNVDIIDLIANATRNTREAPDIPSTVEISDRMNGTDKEYN